MNVVCLVELDEAGVTDASLRALTFARSLAARGPADAGAARPVLAAVAFRPADRVPAGLLGRYLVTEAHLVQPSSPGRCPPHARALTLGGLLSVALATALL